MNITREAATSGMRDKLEDAILRNGPNASRSVLGLIKQNEVLEDQLVSSKQLLFADSSDWPDSPEDREEARLILVHGRRTVHENALGQLAGRYKLPSAYLRELAGGEPWQVELATRMLNMTLANTPERNLLVRSMEGETLAVMSDKYRRMNMAPIFMGFGEAAKANGAVLFNGHYGKLKAWMEVVLPEVFEVNTPKNGPVGMVFGARISSSDFGCGSLEIKLFLLQLVCLNGMTVERAMRKVHLGGRITDHDFALSEDTHRKKTEAVTSEVYDIVRGTLSPEKIDREKGLILTSSEMEVDMAKEVKTLPKLGMTKEEAQLVEQFLMANDPATGVTGGATLWKFAQAVSCVGNQSGPVRMREIHDIAGGIMSRAVTTEFEEI